MSGTMRLSVQLFAALREAASCDAIEVEVPEGAPVSAVLEEVRRHRPDLSEPLERWRPAVAVNRVLARPDQPLRPGDEVALLPPVSGG